jgi:uncharacterized repeat protein (TIGR03806 family)
MGFAGYRQGCALWVIALAACAEASAPVSSDGLDTRPLNAACRAFSAPATTGSVQLTKRFPAIKPDVPTGLVQRPRDNTRWYVLERTGRILHFPNRPDAAASEVKVALDLRDVTYHESDCSLASLAFPPDFEASKRAYVSYCHITSEGLQIRVSRFATTDGGATFDRSSEELIVAVDYTPDDYNNVHTPPGLHGADTIRFGKDGNLYVALGDGGPRTALGAQQSQDKRDIRGKLLRIDVSDLTKTLVDDGIVLNRQRVAARIPADNPFVGLDGNAPAVYAYGFRNPWQWHFDRKTGAIWLGDVGNETWEEVNRDVQKGGNYGWGIYEGTHCTNLIPGSSCIDPTLRQPWLDYTHGSGPQEGNAVTGGVVYRGSAVPSLRGAYIFGDSFRAHIWAVRNVDSAAGPVMKELVFDGVPVSAFAEDQDGEVFVVSLAGEILALEEPPAAPGPTGGGPPRLLSQTGCFDAANQMEPTPDLVPFAPSAELWSDGAAKRRWMTIPDARTITVAADGDFEFPPGTVLIKEFSLAGAKVETRFLVRQEADERWAGYSYRWNDAQTDATLVDATGATATFGGQLWNYPTRAQCQQCHTNAAGNALGPEIAQLNQSLIYPATGRSGNQVATLEKVGLLDTSGAAAPWPKLASLEQGGASVEQRARAYLHANCSNCHRPGGPTFTPPDFRFSVSLADMGICDAEPTISGLEELIPSEPRLLAPGDPNRSVLFQRMSTVDQRFRMPPIGRTLTHAAAIGVVAEWIRNATCP